MGFILIVLTYWCISLSCKHFD